LICVSSVLISCSRSSEEELIGDWQKRDDLGGTQRAFAATFVIGNEGFVIGGTAGYKELLNDVWAFDHTAGGKDIRGNSLGEWNPKGVFPGRARQQAVGFSLKVDGRNYGYVGSGWAWDEEGEEDIRRDFYRYDPSTNSWDPIAPLPESAPARRAAFAFSLKVGGIEYGYVGCGYEGDNSRRNYWKDLWRYDPVNNKWTQEGIIGSKRAGAVVFVINNRAYISTGENTNGTCVDFIMFDPNADEANKWTTLRTMFNANPDEDYDDDYGGLARSFGVAYTALVRDELRGHIVGGQTNGSLNWEYDHVDDLWIQRTKFINNSNRSGVARQGMISFSFPETGRGYVGLGRTGGGGSYFDDMWEFVPLVDDYIYDDH